MLLSALTITFPSGASSYGLPKRLVTQVKENKGKGQNSAFYTIRLSREWMTFAPWPTKFLALLAKVDPAAPGMCSSLTDVSAVVLWSSSRLKSKHSSLVINFLLQNWVHNFMQASNFQYSFFSTEVYPSDSNTIVEHEYQQVINCWMNAQKWY